MPFTDWTEEKMADAIFDMTDNKLSLSKSAAKHGISKMTLFDRFHG